MAGRYKAKRKPYYFSKDTTSAGDTLNTDSLLTRIGNLNIHSHAQDKPVSESKTNRVGRKEASTAKGEVKADDVDTLSISLAKVAIADTASTCRVELRDYQKTLLADVLKALEEKRASVLVYLPTGGGKTVIAAHLIEKYCLRSERDKRRCLFVVNRNALVDQTAKALDKCGFEGKYAFIKSKYVANDAKPVQIASIQTFTRRSKKKETRLKDIQNVLPSSGAKVSFLSLYSCATI